MLLEYYFLDPRIVLVPTEHLSTDGILRPFAEALRERAGWESARVELLSRSFALYWERARTLAARLTHLRPPRRRSIAVVRRGAALRPHAPLLNRSCWCLHESDLDPDRSHAELIAYALLHGDRVADTGEVTRPALDLAPYWLQRSESEARAFAAAAARSLSPDGEIFRAVADALPWLRELRHKSLRPPRVGRHRALSGTGILVPKRHERGPPALLERCRVIAEETVARFRASVATPGDGARQRLCDWLASAAPPVVVTAKPSVVLWSPAAPRQLDLLDRALAESPAEAVDDIRRDLERIAHNTERFQAALADPAALPPPAPDVEQRGYAFLHRQSGRIAYDLYEPEIDRLRSPALPYAREMLGARTWHEWSHLADEAGCVPRTLDDAGWQDLVERFAALLDEAIAGAPRRVRIETAPDLQALSGTGSPGQRLVRLFATRLPDYRANLLATRFMSTAERETYVRQNVRPLDREYRAAQCWRLIIRLLYEAQYLRFSELAEPESYLRDTTYLQDDIFDTGVLEEQAWDRLYAAAGALCEAHHVDESRFVPGALPAAFRARAAAPLPFAPSGNPPC